ncbi:MAG: isoaspartyl peptidase/L-asparaginase [Gammaproteobacteria bacterium]|nr:MAG: isoaspartyl peptidase/L-asparaginase [Gammaproteobacteria bacterium]
MPAKNSASAPRYALAIHGGAGAAPRAQLSPEHERRYRTGLEAALDAGFTLLERGGSALDAVVDAAIMDGRQMRAGAVASVRHVRNPIELARRVMEKSRHVLLVGAGAEEFALEEGLPLVPNHYFRTAERLEQLEAEQRGRHVSDLMPAAAGTVGAVARDGDGNLAAATSTGGMTNKRPGRVGDSPIIGAGTYAKNGVCAVSATGHGEYFIRAVAAHHVCAAVEYRALTLEQAVRELLHEILPALGGDGGLIAVGARGRIVMDFSTEGMFRGARDSSGRREIAVY